MNSNSIYELYPEAIGIGGMAEVFRARNVKFNSDVAVKFLKREFILDSNIKDRFLSEAKNLYRLGHPNLVKVFDLIDEDERVAFVMELVEGETLRSYLNKHKSLDENTMASICRQLLSVMHYIHEQKIVHRDIKPSNIIIQEDGCLKLLDFGISKQLELNHSDYTITGTSMQMGSPSYMSPEQIRSSADVDPRSDIYSIGVILWEMASGKRLYDAATMHPAEIQYAILHHNLPITDTKWDKIIAKATQKNPQLRFENCGEIAEALDALLNEPLKPKESDQTLLNNELSLVNRNQIIQGIQTEDGPRWGLIKKQPEWLFHPEFECVEYIAEVDLFKVLKNGCWGLLNSKGKWIIQPELTQIGYFNEKHIARVKKGHEVGLLHASGRWVEALKSEGIQCGTKVWMAGNLLVDRFRNHDKIYFAQNATEWVNAATQKRPAACFMHYDERNSNHGAFFNWFALNQNEGLSPDGWLLAGPADFQEIQDIPQFQDLLLDFSQYASLGFCNTNGQFESNADTLYFWTFRGAQDGGGQAFTFNIMTKKIAKISIAKSCGLFVRCIKA